MRSKASSLIESVNDHLKNISQIKHSRHRSLALTWWVIRVGFQYSFQSITTPSK
ncbi:MAG: transposase [Pseudanabaenaceae cyanobacterium bins.39]|nr:transposase [Pseudanabaenaceae cyanobacterium bins.39]